MQHCDYSRCTKVVVLLESTVLLLMTFSDWTHRLPHRLFSFNLALSQCPKALSRCSGSLSFWIKVCHPHLQISLFKWLNHILKMVSMLRFCHFYKKTLNFTFVISIQNDALCYSECCTDFINCCVSSIQSYSTSKCVDQSDKSALFWIEVRFSKWRYIFLTNENKWGILCFALIWLFSVNLNECSNV